MMKEQTYIPKLRFPEFSGKWEKHKMGELYSFKVTNSFSRENLNYEKGEVKNIHYGDIHTKFQTLFDITKEIIPFVNNEISIDRIAESNYCQKGDLILADASEDLNDVGKSIEIVNLNNERLLSGLHTILARPISGKFKVGFCGYLFKSNRIRTQIQKESQGTKVLSISVPRISGISLTIPEKAEQQKIATFLSTVDEKLQALKQKKTLLEQYKKGVMQKLFNQNSLNHDSSDSYDENDVENNQVNQKSPQSQESNKSQFRHLRFKDENGKDFPKWEKKKFSEYIKLYRGSSPRPISRFTTNKSNGINWIKIGDTKNSKNYLIECVEEKITIEGSKHSRKVIKGELILANSMSFGKTYLLNINGCIYDGWFVLREFDASYNRDFLHQLLNSDFLQKQYKTLSTGGVVQNISSEIVYSTILLKPSLSEQTKIANFLTAIDEKINHTETQIQQTQEWKKGLLQRMFV